jgi:hypothetical protein
LFLLEEVRSTIHILSLSTLPPPIVETPKLEDLPFYPTKYDFTKPYFIPLEFIEFACYSCSWETLGI